jgi:hypothetical protein
MEPRPLTGQSRDRLEQLLGRLARGYVDSLGPMERLMVANIARARGWDFDRLASDRGPLAAVSTWALEVLALTFADELHAVVLDGGEWRSHPSAADVDAAMAELKGAMA